LLQHENGHKSVWFNTVGALLVTLTFSGMAHRNITTLNYFLVYVTILDTWALNVYLISSTMFNVLMIVTMLYMGMQKAKDK
jgi:hypothetical protein